MVLNGAEVALLDLEAIEPGVLAALQRKVLVYMIHNQNRNPLTEFRLELVPEPVRNQMLIAACQYMEVHPVLPLLVFMAKLRTGPANAIEVVTISTEQGDGTEDWVLLSQRPVNDPDFPGKWCSHGKTLLNHHRLEDALAGLAKADETGIDFTGRPQYAGTVNMPNKPRAHYVCHVFARVLFGLKPEVQNARWVQVKGLCDLNLVGSHRDYVIPMALATSRGASPVFHEDLSDSD